MPETTTEVQTIEWPGASGQNYTYRIYDWSTIFKSIPGNYIFCKLVSDGWLPIYIGEAKDLKSRFSNDFNDHHAIDCINRNGATHIHVHVTKGGKQVRLDEESDLRHNFGAPCNKQ